MDYNEYLQRLEDLDILEKRVGDSQMRTTYKKEFLEVIRKFREIYDMELLSSQDKIRFTSVYIFDHNR